MEGKTISSLPDFAEIFLFLQNLGPYMNLPIISLFDLENFFRVVGLCSSETNVVAKIQHRLLRYVGAKQAGQEWPHMAVKFGRKMGLLTEMTPYRDVTLKVRMKILRCLCEEQFDYNVSLRNVLKRDTPGMLCKPVGVDRNGARYWLLQDSTFDLRLYGEGNYDEPPPVQATWTLLAWSLDELADHISLLESRDPKPADSARTMAVAETTNLPDATSALPRGSPSEGEGEGEEPPARNGGSKRKPSGTQKRGTKRPLGQKTAPSAKKSKGKKAEVLAAAEDSEESEEGGCLKCRKDSDHKKMLLCDTCDRECHTYCQYPVLWTIPRGKWLCPVCKEEELVKKLREVYLHLSQCRLHHEQQVARKERSVARLQKSGVLVQNIILEENDGRRSRRNRKEVNYAELNDVYLPPLGPRDVVGKDWVPPTSTRSTRRQTDLYIQEDYLAPRVRNSTRRFRGASPALDPLRETAEEEEEGDEEEEEERGHLLLRGDDTNGNTDGDDEESVKLSSQCSPTSSAENEEEEKLSPPGDDNRTEGTLERLGHRLSSSRESSGEREDAEEEEEDVRVDDSGSDRSPVVAVEDKVSSLPVAAVSSREHTSVQQKGFDSSAQQKGFGSSVQQKGLDFQHDGIAAAKLREGTGLSWGEGSRSGGFYQYGDPKGFPLGVSPTGSFPYQPRTTPSNWGRGPPGGMYPGYGAPPPIPNSAHFTTPIPNYPPHMMRGIAPISASQHVIEGVAPSPHHHRPVWGMQAPTQSPSSYQRNLQNSSNMLPQAGINAANVSDHQQRLNRRMDYTDHPFR